MFEATPYWDRRRQSLSLRNFAFQKELNPIKRNVDGFFVLGTFSNRSSITDNTDFGGFLGDIGRHPIDWKFITITSAIAIAGIFIGGYFNQKINSDKLKKGFGWFILVMGIYIMVKELLL